DEWVYADDGSRYVPGVFAGKRVAGEGSSEFDARRRQESLASLRAGYAAPGLNPADIHYEDLDTGLIHHQSGRVVNESQVRAARDAQRHDLLRQEATGDPRAVGGNRLATELERITEATKSPENPAGVRHLRALVPRDLPGEWRFIDGTAYDPAKQSSPTRVPPGEDSFQQASRRRRESLRNLAAAYVRTDLDFADIHYVDLDTNLVYAQAGRSLNSDDLLAAWSVARPEAAAPALLDRYRAATVTAKQPDGHLPSGVVIFEPRSEGEQLGDAVRNAPAGTVLRYPDGTPYVPDTKRPYRVPQQIQDELVAALTQAAPESVFFVDQDNVLRPLAGGSPDPAVGDWSRSVQDQRRLRQLDEAPEIFADEELKRAEKALLDYQPSPSRDRNQDWIDFLAGGRPAPTLQSPLQAGGLPHVAGSSAAEGGDYQAGLPVDRAVVPASLRAKALDDRIAAAYQQAGETRPAADTTPFPMDRDARRLMKDLPRSDRPLTPQDEVVVADALTNVGKRHHLTGQQALAMWALHPFRQGLDKLAGKKFTGEKAEQAAMAERRRIFDEIRAFPLGRAVLDGDNLESSMRLTETLKSDTVPKAYWSYSRVTLGSGEVRDDGQVVAAVSSGSSERVFSVDGAHPKSADPGASGQQNMHHSHPVSKYIAGLSAHDLMLALVSDSGVVADQHGLDTKVAGSDAWKKLTIREREGLLDTLFGYWERDDQGAIKTRDTVSPGQGGLLSQARAEHLLSKQTASKAEGRKATARAHQALDKALDLLNPVLRNPLPRTAGESGRRIPLATRIKQLDQAFGYWDLHPGQDAKQAQFEPAFETAGNDSWTSMDLADRKRLIDQVYGYWKRDGEGNIATERLVKPGAGGLLARTRDTSLSWKERKDAVGELRRGVDPLVTFTEYRDIAGADPTGGQVPRLKVVLDNPEGYYDLLSDDFVPMADARANARGTSAQVPFVRSRGQQLASAGGLSGHAVPGGVSVGVVSGAVGRVLGGESLVWVAGEVGVGVGVLEDGVGVALGVVVPGGVVDSLGVYRALYLRRGVLESLGRRVGGVPDVVAQVAAMDEAVAGGVPVDVVRGWVEEWVGPVSLSEALEGFEPLDVPVGVVDSPVVGVVSPVGLVDPLEGVEVLLEGLSAAELGELSAELDGSGVVPVGEWGSSGPVVDPMEEALGRVVGGGEDLYVVAGALRVDELDLAGRVIAEYAKQPVAVLKVIDLGEEPSAVAEGLGLPLGTVLRLVAREQSRRLEASERRLVPDLAFVQASSYVVDEGVSLPSVGVPVGGVSDELFVKRLPVLSAAFAGGEPDSVRVGEVAREWGLPESVVLGWVEQAKVQKPHVVDLVRSQPVADVAGFYYLPVEVVVQWVNEAAGVPSDPRDPLGGVVVLPGADDAARGTGDSLGLLAKDSRIMNHVPVVVEPGRLLSVV
ncbi:MAG: hypothetical protein ACRCYQ_12690, partial [Nocardioides sp.]